MRTLLVTTACVCGLAACTRTPGPERPAEPSADIESAAMPFRILELPGGREIEWEEFALRAGEVDAICAGESHTNPHHHWAQLQVVEALVAGGDAALGMEMFQRPFQGVLDDYAAGRIDETTMLARTGWEERWGYDFALYRPMIEAAVQAGASLLALNAPRDLVRKVSRKGLAALTPTEREAVPELDLDDADHRAWFLEVMEGLGDAHGHGGAASHGGHDAESHEHGEPESHGQNDDPAMSADERLYAAQVLWDESMAEAAAEWLTGGDDRRVVILAGNGHCHDSAIARRIERRGDFEAISVRPIIDASDGRVADLVADSRHDFLFVMIPPEP